MTTHPENLKPGDWIAVVGHRDLDNQDDEPQMVMSMFGPSVSRPSPPPQYNGLPSKVVAISLPFICITDGKATEALDIRQIRVQKVSKRYAKAMIAGRRSEGVWAARQNTTDVQDVADVFNMTASDIVMSSSDVLTFKMPRTCPVCQEAEMKETLTEGEREWKLSCPSCGFTGTRPNEGNDDDAGEKPC